MDFVFKCVRDGSEQTRSSSGAEVGPGWTYTIQVGLRVLFDVFR